MICEKTPEGNEHVDNLIVKLMQNCESEHIDRLMNDYMEYRETINNRTERRYDPNHTGIDWKKFARNRVTSEPVPINLRRRERVLLGIFKGMISNPNIKIDQIIRILRINDDVTQNFTDAQFDVLQESLLNGECVFTREELMEGSKKYLGINAEKLEKMLESADKRKQDRMDKIITPSAVAKNALKSGLTTYEYNKANGVEKELTKIKEGVTKDD